ncbi:DUF6311 domain-containing protein [Pseudomonas purpurea]|uniref:DUF6311 domain-containing protein n=1 Tax=Pseudomonas purpurea TaxID=3136737 RepID=UPI003263C932
MTESGKQRAIALIPVLMGVLAFFMVIGPRVLDPQNIAWLENGDPATHYLGWAFFRQSPWTFPLGLNPSYGMELGNAIIFSDSNPLLALLFKPFAAWLPQPFQYFGFWLLACFVMQAWFAWKLLGLVTDSIVLRMLGIGLFLFSPPMMLRMGAHLSLAGHFLILAALYLALHPQLQRRRGVWGLLLSVTALVHAYLLAMVALIWLADLFGKYLLGKLPRRTAVTEGLLLFGVVGLCCWQAGYFSVGAGTISGGFGAYRMNLSALVDSNGWSYVLQDIPGAPDDYEGLNFLGLGAIFLAICALVILLQGRSGFVAAVRRRPMLLLALVGLTLFAMSNQIGFGLFEFHYPLPSVVISAANVFRASGRMFWPVFYVILFAIFFLVVRGNSPRAAVCLLAVALVAQVLDTRGGWLGLRHNRMMAPASAWATPMHDPFWASAAAHYQKIRSLQPQNQPAGWSAIATYASLHGLPTDAAYLGRMGNKALKQARRTATQVLDSGQYAADALYILDTRALQQGGQHINTQTDLLARIDGFIVLAPGWKQCADCLAVQGVDNPLALLAPVTPGERQLFNQVSTQLVSGWSVPEAWGTWSNQTEAEIALRVSAPVHSLTLDAIVFVQPNHPTQDLIVTINNVQALSARLIKADGNPIEIPLTPALQQAIAADGMMRIRLQLPNAISPKALGMGGDDRRLGLGLKALTVQ